MENNNIIELKNVTLGYGGADVVRDVNLGVKKGETKVILGPSGVGKSTILKALLGLIKPESGEIYIEGQPISSRSEKAMLPFRCKMAMVFQGGALFDSMTVEENVSFRLRELDLIDRTEVDTRVGEVLRFVDMYGAKDLKPAQLSGGMKKRVAVARALASHPEIFLFDEPTVGLDPYNVYNIEQLILRLKKEKKVTIVIVTHDIESTFRLADSVAMIHKAEVIFDGVVKELKHSRDERIKFFLHPGSHFGFFSRH